MVARERSERKSSGILLERYQRYVVYCFGRSQFGFEHFDETKTRLFFILDLCGLVSPFTIKLRLLMRELWKQQLDWDQLVPNDIAIHAREVIQDVARLSDLAVPRNARLEDLTTLHVFCDASQLAFGSAAFIVSSRLDSPKRLLTSRVK